MEALRLFNLSAEAGYGPGLNALGTIFEAGLVVNKDLGKAQDYYFAAAAQGDTMAMQNLGAFYCNGRLGYPDLVKARMWYQKAAEKGAQQSEMIVKEIDEQLRQQERDLERLGVLKWEKENHIVDPEPQPFQQRLARFMESAVPGNKTKKTSFFIKKRQIS